MQRRVRAHQIKDSLREPSSLSSLEARYVGTWVEGKRHGPGEMHFGQYRFVGRFHQNYVSDEHVFVRNGIRVALVFT